MEAGDYSRVTFCFSEACYQSLAINIQKPAVGISMLKLYCNFLVLTQWLILMGFLFPACILIKQQITVSRTWIITLGTLEMKIPCYNCLQVNGNIHYKSVPYRTFQLLTLRVLISGNATLTNRENLWM